MVVKRSDLFFENVWHGLETQNLQKYLTIIVKKHRFLPRSEVESDPNWQQIIPYLIFENQGKIFLMRRKSSHTDRRLSNLYSIGIGGHIDKEDIIKSTKSMKSTRGTKGNELIFNWAKREFEEEIKYDGQYIANFLGLLNDDSNDVGRVHIGLVVKLTGDSPKITVRDEHKSGKLVGLEEAGKNYKKMETWSQIVYDFLVAKMKKAGDFSGILPDCRAGTYRFIDTNRGLPDDAMEEINLKVGDPFILEPGAFAIATTQEDLKLPNDIIGRLEGKSSLARLGILVHSTAARFDPGWNGAPVLELGNLGPKPAILYCGMPICAFTFEKLSAPVKMPYAGSRSDRYSGSKKPVPSKIEKHPSTSSGQVGRRKKK
ncbi:MAG: Deoxycytidine triphosphate deaminase [Candidatus Curtissbacteria bacterium GW2011_GWA2_41_24]|uniref:Deoxycytidine triphosphate deaminase n=1 Tax=Candidatus Curtissbacteria bacterium GW2011_GWA2_41_24 TaxID=1618411 RepID=A0A0G0VZ17_9BACT|nr:MAG: Deoxycytidine triphosphate deaminase [Candidatus Curtissbacteria bacterium GW2011_GWA2_41_24]